MRSTLFRSALAFLLPLLGGSAMAQSPQDSDCNECACTIGGSHLIVAAANACPGPGTVTTSIAAGSTFRRFNTTIGNRYRVSVCGATALNTVMFIRQNSGSFLPVEGACDDDGCGVSGGASSVEFTATATSHRVYIYLGACGTTITSAMNITFTCLGADLPPANDEPCNAVAIPLSSTSCTSQIAGTTQAATQTSSNSLDAAPLNPNNGCGAVNFGGGDVWYSVTVPATGLIGVEVQESGVCATGIGLYTAPDCAAGPYTWLTGSATGVCSIDGLSGPNGDPGIVFDPATYGLTAGQTVYIRIWERNNNENGNFTICAYNAQAPVNDEPCGAILLTPGDPCVPAEYNTINAQPKPTGLTINPMNCGLPTPTYTLPSAWNAVARDVWFRVVVPPTNNMTVTLFSGTLTDMAMSWYRATGNICGPGYGGSLTQITPGGCHDNIGGGNNMPRINSNTAGITLTSGETIYIRVWNRETNAFFYHGTFSICVTPNFPPPNDDPCGAIPLEVGGGECILFPATNENATNTGTTFPPGASSVPAPCGTPVANYNDVWFTVEVPLSVSATNALILDTDDLLPLNFAMAAYRDVSGVGCPTLLTLTAVGSCSTAGSQQGSPPNGSMPRLTLTPPTITPGETLYIRVWGEITNNQQGPFSICAQTANPPDCTGTFYDSGGAAGQYQNSESQIRFHCAEKAGDVVTLNFTQFSLESGYDFIRIYNQPTGPANPANLIGSYTGNTIPNQISGTVTASNPNGCLMVVFSSDFIITGPGYTYKVSCGPPAIAVPGTCSVYSISASGLNTPNVTTSFDPGGQGGTTYPGNLGVQNAGIAPYHIRYCSNTPGEAVTMNFTSFDIEDNFDGLYIFDGNIAPGTALNTAGPLAAQINSGNPGQLTWSGAYNPPVPPTGAFWGEGGPGTITATVSGSNPNGCLTLVLYSDAIVSGSGWEASVSCGPPPPPPPPTPCDALFYETVGGSTGNYANNVTATQTFCGLAGYILTATFSQFNTEANWDKMYVFDGPSTASPMIASNNGIGFGPAPFGPGSYWGTGIPGPFTSSTPGGCLTFHFVSDASVVRTGWVAKLSCAAQAPNDNPCNPTGATLITPGSSCVPQTFNNTSTTPTTGPPLPGCGNYQGGDVWFRFVAPPSGRVYIDTHAGTLTDAAMALYSSVNCSGPFTLMECDDDDGEGLMPAIDRMCSPLTPGQTYWLRVWGYGDRRGTFDLCIVEGPGNTTNQTDCGGAFSLCGAAQFTGIAYGNGCGPDLTPTNWGCLLGERQGSWYALSTNVAGQLGMTITPTTPTDIDWAIWGPFSQTGEVTSVGSNCLSTAPKRCSSASRSVTMTPAAGPSNPTAATGMGHANTTLNNPQYGSEATQYWDGPNTGLPLPTAPAVDGWVPGINITPGDVYLLFVDDHHLDGTAHTVEWSVSPTNALDCQILPVEAMQLEAAPQVRTVDLVWTTTREQNSSHFIIERSTDGVHFMPIGRMDAVGNSESLTSYQSVDDAPVVGLNYYRLQQVDMDGTIAVSNTVTALFKPNTTTVMVVPNPALDQAELLMSAAYEGTLMVRILDGSGRLVASFLAPEGMQRMALPIADLEGGSYTVHLMTEKGESHARTRFVKH